MSLNPTHRQALRELVGFMSSLHDNIEQLSSKEWLGDEQQTPGEQRLFDESITTSRELLAETKTFIEQLIEHAQQSNPLTRPLVRERLNHTLKNIDHLVAQLQSSMGTLSFELAAHHKAQLLHNENMDDSYQPETPAPIQEIIKHTKETLPMNDMFTNIKDAIAIKKLPEDTEVSPLATWMSSKRTPTELLKDKKGFKELTDETRTPIEDKLLFGIGITSSLIHQAENMASACARFQTLISGADPNSPRRSV